MAGPAVPPGLEDAERRILAGDLAGAAAALADSADADAADPARARLRLFLALSDVPFPAGSRPEADAEAVVPAAGRPPPDLPALASAATGPGTMQRMIEVERRLTVASSRRAEALLAQGDAKAARDLIEQTLASLTANAQSFQLFGRINAALGRPSDAVFAHERAVDLAPADRAARIALAHALLTIQDCERAARMLAADAVGPDEEAAFSDRLFAMARTEADPGRLVAETLRYRARAASRIAPAPAGRPVPDVPVIGFLWNQRHRGAAMWMADLLRHRTPDRYRAILYGVGLTRRFEGSELAERVDQVVVCGASTPAMIAGRMQQDAVDLLVSFAGHDEPELLAALDRRPARVVVEWLETGWPSGHPTVSHLVADRGHCPPETGRSMDIRVAAFPTVAISGGPALAAADAAGRDRAADGAFAYGWCGPAATIGEATLAAWTRIMKEHPAAQLRLLHDDWRVGSARERVAHRLMGLGVEGRRLDFDSPERAADQIAMWQRVDVALDTFPAGDIATTMEALAMGVPIVTIAGAHHAGRHAAVALSVLGMGELVARDTDGYVAKVLDLAARPAALAELRRRIPERMRASPLAGTDLQARSFESMIDLLLGIRRGS